MRGAGFASLVELANQWGSSQVGAASQWGVASRVAVASQGVVASREGLANLEDLASLVESAIQSMEEPQMALYLQVGPVGRGAGSGRPPSGWSGGLCTGKPGSRLTSGSYLPRGFGQVTLSIHFFP